MSRSVRISIDGRGHREIRTADGSSLKIHRLAALAWGIIDSLDDPREVHHSIADRTWNAEDNLEAVDSSEHTRITNIDRTARRARCRAGEELVTDGGTVLGGPSKMERCDGCGTMTAAPTRYGRVAQGTGAYAVAYCTTCETIRRERDIRPERHPQYRLREVSE